MPVVDIAVATALALSGVVVDAMLKTALDPEEQRMFRLIIAWLCATLLPGCSTQPPAEPNTRGVESQPQPQLTQDRRSRGYRAYAQVCARCHDTGLDGAPITGRRDDWRERSGLWQAVLFRHAEEGYLRMPARGGDQTLGDAEVKAAAEYMLSITHPEVPAD